MTFSYQKLELEELVYSLAGFPPALPRWGRVVLLFIAAQAGPVCGFIEVMADNLIPAVWAFATLLSQFGDLVIAQCLLQERIRRVGEDDGGVPKQFRRLVRLPLVR